MLHSKIRMPPLDCTEVCHGRISIDQTVLCPHLGDLHKSARHLYLRTLIL